MNPDKCYNLFRIGISDNGVNKNMNKNDSMDSGEDFAALFEKSLSELDSPEPGQLMETTIVAISKDCVFLQLNGKSEGLLDIEELLDKEGELTVKTGDTIKAYFLFSRNGEMHFTTRIKGDNADKAVLEKAYENGIPVEGLVEKEIKGGFEIRIGDSRAFCPYSQMGLKRIENPEDYIGSKRNFKIMEFREDGRNILVSNRAPLEKEQKERTEILKKTLREDMTVKGTIQSIQAFGAFVDIGGIQALLPVSEISRSQVKEIKAVLSVGQEIEASVITLDWKNNRITLSMKALLSDPWDEARIKYKEGSIHTGKVARITDFGVFISLEPGLDGLIHVSDLRSDTGDSHPRHIVKAGQSFKVRINNINAEKHKISLKPVSSAPEDEDYSKYMEPESTAYNPFADFMKGKADKSDGK